MIGVDVESVLARVARLGLARHVLRRVERALTRPVKAARMMQEFVLPDHSHFKGLDTWTR